MKLEEASHNDKLSYLSILASCPRQLAFQVANLRTAKHYRYPCLITQNYITVKNKQTNKTHQRARQTITKLSSLICIFFL